MRPATSLQPTKNSNIQKKNPPYVATNKSNYKNYYGRRQGKNRKPYIKIITKLEKNKPEKITTIYTVRKKD